MKTRETIEDTALVGSIAGLVLILLKLWGKIDLSWTWVLMPFWVGKVVMGVVVILLIVFIVWLIRKRRKELVVELDLRVSFPGGLTEERIAKEKAVRLKEDWEEDSGK